MRSVPLSEAKDKLSALVDDVEREHDVVHITRHGRSAAVLISQDDLDSMRESLFWLSQPGLRDDIAEAREAVEVGEAVDADDVRARFGLPAS